MRVVIRYFFRTLRLLLTPIVLLGEKLTRPTPLPRSSEEQRQLDSAATKLALYQFRACPFCIRVRKEMARLSLPVAIRDAQHDLEHRSDLATQGGRIKVPCLLIQGDEGREEWLYESKAINAWLQQQFEVLPRA